MSSTATQEETFRLARNAEFERRVSEATERAILEMDKLVANEVKLRYITHIFAMTLVEIGVWLVKPRFMN